MANISHDFLMTDISHVFTNTFFESTSRTYIRFRKVILRSVFRALRIHHCFYYKSDWANNFGNVTKNAKYWSRHYWNIEPEH